MGDVGAWLESIGLGQYADAFAENDFDWALLSELDHDLLKDIGVESAGHRVRILKATSLLPASESSDSDTAPPVSHAPSDGEAERRQLTVMFCDLVGSTALSESMDPEDYREVLGAYQSVARAAIEQYGGYVARYMGDGLLVYYGYPQAHEDDSERAVRSALALVSTVEELQAGLQVRVGIATGRVVAGDIIGEGASEEHAVLGDTPNLAARLQGLATPNAIVVADATHALVSGLFSFEDLGAQSLKGFSKPVQPWRVTGENVMGTRFAIRQRVPLTPLVGRNSEFALLCERWQQAQDGDGQALLLSGEAGIGKSRLTQALMEKIAPKRHRLWQFQCSPHHVNSAFYPVIATLQRDAAFRPEENADARVTKLTSLLPGTPDEGVALVAGLLSIHAGQSTDSVAPGRRRELIAVLIDGVVGASAEAPTLVIVEDVHWADPSTLEVLSALVARIPETSALLVATHRPGFEAPWRDRDHVSALSLTRLSRRQRVEMVEQVVGVRSLPPEFANSIATRTDGIPLFVEELTRAILDSGYPPEAASRPDLVRWIDAAGIPATLHDSLTARLDALGDAKETAQLAAAIGREFSEALLRRASPLCDRALDDALARLVDSGLVYHRAHSTESLYVFKHALVQDAAYDGLLKAKRRELHARIADALLGGSPERCELEPELLARHLTEARDYEDALEYWQRAARSSVESSAHEEAIAHMEQALAVLAQLPRDTARDERELRLQIDLGRSQMAVRGYGAPEVGEAYSRAEALVELAGDTHQQFTLLRGRVTHHMMRAEYAQAEALANRCLTLAQAQGNSTWTMRAKLSLAQVSVWSTEDCIAAHQMLVALINELESNARERGVSGRLQDSRVSAEVYATATSWSVGYPDQAREHLRHAVSIAEGSGHPFSRAEARLWASSLSVRLREPVEAEKNGLAAITLAEQYSFSHPYTMASVFHGWATAMQGQEAGIVQLHEGIAAYRSGGGRLALVAFLSMLAEAMLEHGRYDDALASAEQAASLVQEIGETASEAYAQIAQGQARIALGMEAEPGLREAIIRAKRRGQKSFELRASLVLAEHLTEQGRRREAQELLAPIYDWFTEGFDTPDLKKTKALLGQLS